MTKAIINGNKSKQSTYLVAHGTYAVLAECEGGAYRRVEKEYFIINANSEKAVEKALRAEVAKTDDLYKGITSIMFNYLTYKATEAEFIAIANYERKEDGSPKFTDVPETRKVDVQ